MFTNDGKMQAIDHNASLIISQDEDILSFQIQLSLSSAKCCAGGAAIVDIIDKFYDCKEKILGLIDKYIHDNTKLAKVMVESRINY